MDLSLLILFCVLALIAARRIGNLRVEIWQAMTAGAVAVLVSGQISPRDAVRAVDFDVMGFLFGMFIIGEALIKSGVLNAIAYRLFSRVRSTDTLVLALLFTAGLASALLMNDTLAVIGTPLVLQLAREHRIAPPLLLLTLAFAITIGSVMSPIGNPQNLLIAVRAEMEAPFVTFAAALGPPTLVNLLITYGVLRVLYRSEFHPTPLAHTPVGVADPALARLARLAMVIVVAAVFVRIASATLSWDIDLRLSYIALAGALPLLLSPRRMQLVRAIDWATLLFFVALFIITASVWQAGVLQALLARLQLDLAAPLTIAGVSLVLSQLISNVPLVALYLPALDEAGATSAALLSLAAGSTIAGNLLIFGAASNIIIIQRAERQAVTLGFGQFARAGIPLGLVNILIYLVYLDWFCELSG